jgi:hypothetical protein
MAQPNRKQPKSKRINVSIKEKWKQILREVSKEEIPIHLLESITINLIDGTPVHIDVIQLLAEGDDPEEVEDQINSRLDELDAYISDVDFFISIDSVVETVQPFTDKILKNL